MPQIRPITDLRNTNEISEICHQGQEPVFITKNGYGDLVVMSMETYERQMAIVNVYKKLLETDPTPKSTSLIFFNDPPNVPKAVLAPSMI